MLWYRVDITDSAVDQRSWWYALNCGYSIVVLAGSARLWSLGWLTRTLFSFRRAIHMVWKTPALSEMFRCWLCWGKDCPILYFTRQRDNIYQVYRSVKYADVDLLFALPIPEQLMKRIVSARAHCSSSLFWHPYISTSRAQSDYRIRKHHVVKTEWSGSQDFCLALPDLLGSWKLLNAWYVINTQFRFLGEMLSGLKLLIMR